MDDEYIYLILEYCKCGNLTECIDHCPSFPKYLRKLYAAEILLALESLHKNDIVYRDLKPDNVVVDLDQHIKLTDFGLSIQGITKPLQANSFCGSLAYLAPEIIKETGHGKSVDWYLFGTLLYELSHGTPPFFTEERHELFDRIINCEPQFDYQLEPDLKDLLIKVSLPLTHSYSRRTH